MSANISNVPRFLIKLFIELFIKLVKIFTYIIFYILSIFIRLHIIYRLPVEHIMIYRLYRFYIYDF